MLFSSSNAKEVQQNYNGKLQQIQEDIKASKLKVTICPAGIYTAYRPYGSKGWDRAKQEYSL